MEIFPRSHPVCSLVYREGTIRRPDLTLDSLEAALQMTTMMMSQKMMYQTMVMV
jgi:hypothetical protein